MSVLQILWNVNYGSSHVPKYVANSRVSHEPCSRSKSFYRNAMHTRVLNAKSVS